MKRSNVFALVALVTGVMIWGCSQSTTGTSGPSTADLIGKWVYSSVHIIGSTVIHFGIQGFPDSTIHIDSTITFSGAANFAQLNADMTYMLQMPGMASLGAPAADSGTWSHSGSTLRLFSYAKDTTDLSVSINGSNGTFANTTSQRLDNPTGILPGSYVQTNMNATMIAIKQ